MEQTQILVVGAGPTGLAAAAILKKQGLKVRVIDKNASRSDKSKALGVQAGTLECLKAALSPRLSETMVQAGRPTREAWLHFNDGEPTKVNLGLIPSEYNFILILEQSETERILEEYVNELSVKVERQTELLSFENQGSHLISKIKLPSGNIQEVQSSFIIGCDGAHSTVRHQLNIPFEGGAYSGDFILGDVKLEWKWPYDSVQTFVSKRGAIASFPMRGEQRYRLILIPKNLGPESRTPSIELKEFQEVLKDLSQDQIKVLEASWLTRFSVHHRMVKYFQKDRVFLAGDAAHIHSPAGGQGMNTGIQDALNLGFKLSRVLLKNAPINDLKDYERERMPVARNVLRSTDLVFRFGIVPENFAVNWLRKNIIPKIARTSWVQNRVVEAISEMNIAKREIKGYQS